GVTDNTDVAYSVARQNVGGNAGKLIVAGTTHTGGTPQVRLFRLDSGGKVDTTFGSSGFTSNDFSGNTGNRPRKIIVDANDKIYLIGDVSSGGGSNLLLARYSSNGALDFSNTFNAAFFEEG